MNSIAGWVAFCNGVALAHRFDEDTGNAIKEALLSRQPGDIYSILKKEEIEQAIEDISAGRNTAEGIANCWKKNKILSIDRLLDTGLAISSSPLLNTHQKELLVSCTNKDLIGNMESSFDNYLARVSGVITALTIMADSVFESKIGRIVYIDDINESGYGRGTAIKLVIKRPKEFPTEVGCFGIEKVEAQQGEDFMLLEEEEIYEKLLDSFIRDNYTKIRDFTGNMASFASAAHSGQLGQNLGNFLGRKIKGKKINYEIMPCVYYGHVHDSEGNEVLFGNNVAGVCVNSHFPFSLDEKMLTEKEDNDTPRLNLQKLDYLHTQVSGKALMFDKSAFEGADLKVIETLSPENITVREESACGNAPKGSKQDFLLGFLDTERMLLNSLSILENDKYTSRFSVTPLFEPEKDEYIIMELNKKVLVEKLQAYHHDRLGIISRVYISKKGKPMSELCKSGRRILTSILERFRDSVLTNTPYSFEPPEW